MKPLRLSKPHLLIVVGIPGSGKTFFASQFSKTFSIPYVHYGAIQHLRDPMLSEEETAVYAGMLFRELIKTHQTILIEGPGTSSNERASLVQQARAAGYEPLFIWVQTEQSTAHNRAVKGKGRARGADKSLNQTISNEEFDDEVGRFAAFSAKDKPVVISGKHTYASQAKTVLKRLVEPVIKARHDASMNATARPSPRVNTRRSVDIANHANN